MQDWVDHVIWWQVYPLGFVGAEAEAVDRTEHRLDRIEGWFDYLLELGCNGLALGPVFASETHGYDTVDHLRIDSRLGTDSDMDALIGAARAKGIRVLLDGVFNHVGRSHPQFVRAEQDGPDSDAGRWFRWKDGRPRTFEGHDLLVELNHDEPAVQEHVAQVMTHWLDRGVDGWRLDAAYAVSPAFWAAVLPRVREAHPDAWIVGEMIHGDYASYVRESGLDSITQYELWKATWSALKDANFFEFAHALGRHDELLPTFVPATFVGNHDVTRIASTLDDDDADIAAALLFFVAGTPTVYYGDEQGFHGIKEERVGGDDAIRPEFPATPDDLAPYGWPHYRRHQALIAMRRRFPWLHRAHAEVSGLENTAVTLTATDGTTTLVLSANIGDAPVPRPAGDIVAAADGVENDLRPHSWAVTVRP
ncbi:MULTISPECIES: alpha-amylase family protein [unclassified Rhodococcus (in: high G+C Gram-positive bacteria)]|uniref:alpha-amylase family protein n=1 Tax=unclassified Rhodococcus (in: high G+C Gram-positive bacteria) TaxID=192944 RepID=UPI0006FF9B53|nr:MULTISPECIES: alpha-amylase family protein [unclassified Rhodococcus (in: high G+C Gram-positive bacteria)]KQU39205.1 alpha-amylase [Rhodococcus sp. Leaf225]KQU43641.1 alpha-amylase [Rhodococcus sp. Leaf258]